MFHYANSKNPKLTNWPLQPQKNNKPNETEIRKDQDKTTVTQVTETKNVDIPTSDSKNSCTNDKTA